MDARIQGRLGTAFTGLVNGLRQARAATGPRTPAALLERIRSADVDRTEVAVLPRLRIAAAGSAAPPPVPAGATGGPVDGLRVAGWTSGLAALADAAPGPDPALDRVGRALGMLGEVVRERDELIARARGELS